MRVSIISICNVVLTTCIVGSLKRKANKGCILNETYLTNNAQRSRPWNNLNQSCHHVNNVHQISTACGLLGTVVPNDGGGNCFFEAVSDQLLYRNFVGMDLDHISLRSGIVDYLRMRVECVRIFSSSDVKWDDYLEKMKKNGTYAQDDVVMYMPNYLKWVLSAHYKFNCPVYIRLLMKNSSTQQYDYYSLALEHQVIPIGAVVLTLLYTAEVAVQGKMIGVHYESVRDTTVHCTYM